MSYQAGSAYVTVRPDMTSFNDDIGNQMQGLDAQAAEAGASAGAAYSEAFAEAAHAEVPDVTIHADADTTEADVALDEAAHERTVPMDIDVAELEAKLAAVQAQLDELQAKQEKINVDSSALDDAKSKALALGITLAAVGSVPSLVALASIIGGVGAGFAAAALTGGGFTAVTEHLEGDLRTGAEQVSGFGSALHDVGTTGLKDFSDAAALAGDGIGHLFIDLAPEIQKADGFITEIATDFDNWAKSVNGSELESFFSKLFGGINTTELKTDLSDIVSLIGNLAKSEQEMSPIAMGAMTDFLNILAHLPPPVLDALIVLFAAMKTVGAVSGLVQWASSIGDSIDKVKTKLDSLFGSSEESEAEAAGTETGEAYAEGVETGATAGGGVGAEVASELEEGTGVAAAAGTETGEAYAEGVETGATAGGGVGAEVGAELAEGEGVAAAAGAETGAAYAEGMEAGAAGAAAVGEEAAAELETGTAEAAGVGAEMGAEFSEGMSDSIEGVGDVVLEAVGVMSDIAMEGGMEAGEMLSAGFAAGILEGLPEVLAAATEVAEVAEATMAAVLLIESPSRVAFGLGEYFALGFAGGQLATRDTVADASATLAHASVDALSATAAAQSLAALGGRSSIPGGGAAAGGALQLELSYAGSGNALTNEIVKSLRVDIHDKAGGDVQAHLGRGMVRIPR